MSDPEEQPRERDISLRDIAKWAQRHPAMSLFALALLSLWMLPAASSVSSPGFIVMIFGAGVYPSTGILIGLISIFSRQLLALTAYEKLRVIVLSITLLAASTGVWIFLWFFLVEYYIQLTCLGAGCAQGGIAVVAALPLAWLSYVIARALCWAFIRFKWWPSACSPRFP
jgi:hypothetical protein